MLRFIVASVVKIGRKCIELHTKTSELAISKLKWSPKGSTSASWNIIIKNENLNFEWIPHLLLSFPGNSLPYLCADRRVAGPKFWQRGWLLTIEMTPWPTFWVLTNHMTDPIPTPWLTPWLTPSPIKIVKSRQFCTPVMLHYKRFPQMIVMIPMAS